MDRGLSRLAGIAGLLTVVSVLLSVFPSGIPPSTGSSAAGVSAWIAAHRAGLQVSGYFSAVTLAVSPFYLAGLFGLLRGGTRDWMLPGVAVLGGISTFLVGAAGAVAGSALAFQAANLGDLALNRAIFDLVAEGAFLLYLPAGAMVMAGSLQAQRSAAFPAALLWEGWAYVLLCPFAALAAVSSAFVFTVLAGLALALLLAWIAATSVLLTWRPGERRSQRS